MDTLNSKQVFKGRILSVRVDELRLDNGKTINAEVVEHAQSVTVVPMLDDRTVILIRQLRYPIGETLLETPAGSVDEGESAEEAAQRELEEEINYRADEMIRLGAAYLAPGWATEFMHVFLARNLQHSPGTPDVDEAIDLVEMPLTEAMALVQSGELRDMKSIAALSLAQAYLSRQG